MMTTFTFQGQEFQMDNSAKLFLEKYLKRIEVYAKKHQISPDMIDDLQQSIGEKLFTLKQPITQKKLIALINSFGEPEAIFEEEAMVSLPIEKESGGFFPALARFFGAIGRCIKVCFLGFCTGIRLMIKWIALGMRFFIKWLWIGGGFFFKYLGIGLCYFFKYLGIGLWKFFSIGGRVLGIIVLFVIMLSLIATLGMRFGDITVLNQSFKLLAPQWIVWGLGGMLVCCCFWMMALVSSFSTTPLKNWYVHLVVLIVFFGGSSIAGVAALTSLTQMRVFTHRMEIDLAPLASDQPLQLIIPTKIEAGIQDWNIGLRPVSSTDKEMKIVIESRFWAMNVEQAERIKSAIVVPEVFNLSGALYQLTWPEGQIFREVVPFNAIELRTDVYSPEGSVEVVWG